MRNNQKIAATVDNYVKGAVNRGANYEKLEEWLEDWVKNADALRKYNGVEIYEAFHLMAPSIGKWTALINNEELHFSLDKFPLDFADIKGNLKAELTTSKYQLLVPVDELKYQECKQVLRKIKFGRSLPLHLQGVVQLKPQGTLQKVKMFLVRKMNINPVLLDEKVEGIKSATKSVFRAIQNVLGVAKTKMFSFSKMTIKSFERASKFLKAVSVTTTKKAWVVTTATSQKTYKFSKRKFNETKINLAESKRKNFGINVVELKRNIVNVMFYGYLGGFLLILMLINL